MLPLFKVEDVYKNALILLYRVSTLKRPDFGDVLEIGNWFSVSDGKGLLHNTGVQIPA
jgi:hypothetical protein